MSVILDNSASPEPSERKRKRDSTNAPELEIDVSLPEPPSKKALRKAKKTKLDTDREEPAESGGNSAIAGGDLPQGNGTVHASTKSDSTQGKRSGFGIWIGNLPWSMDRQGLKSFFASNSTIQESQISRIHMPAPSNAVATKTQLKPQNKGFAYVDFDTNETMETALALSETPLGGRNVLIKNAKSFEGRPETKQAAQTNRRDAEAKQNPPTKKVFVGNLGFDVTKDDLREHFRTCGDLEDIHMATFEDSGKCKGYAWISFSEQDAAKAAVRGWVIIAPQNDGIEEELEDEAGKPNESKKQKAKKSRGRKWFVNRLAGRSLRCEFAEDSTIRYKKRFGKDSSQSRYSNGGEDTELGETDGGLYEEDAATIRKPKDHSWIQPGAPTDPTKRRGKEGSGQYSKSTDNSRKSKALEEARYRTGAMAEGAGVKVTFD